MQCNKRATAGRHRWWCPMMARISSERARPHQSDCQKSDNKLAMFTTTEVRGRSRARERFIVTHGSSREQQGVATLSCHAILRVPMTSADNVPSSRLPCTFSCPACCPATTEDRQDHRFHLHHSQFATLRDKNTKIKEESLFEKRGL